MSPDPSPFVRGRREQGGKIYEGISSVRWVQISPVPPFLELTAVSHLRYFTATKTYNKTKDFLFTQKILGHRSISLTITYMHLVDYEEENEFIVKVATTIEDFTALESGLRARCSRASLRAGLRGC
jgi:hypothetical protein